MQLFLIFFHIFKKKKEGTYAEVLGVTKLRHSCCYAVHQRLTRCLTILKLKKKKDIAVRFKFELHPSQKTSHFPSHMTQKALRYVHMTTLSQPPFFFSGGTEG